MSSAALSPDGLLPRPAGGLAPGAALALMVHAGLVAALTLGVDWRSHPPEVVTAELWAALPQVAAPPPPPPVVAAPAPPAPVAKPEVKTEVPPEADIALERERRQKAEAKKLEDERKRQEAATELKRKADDKKAEAERKKREAEQAAREAEEKAEDERLAKQRQENLRRMMGQAATAPNATGTAGATGTAAQSAAPSATYLGRIRAAVLRELVFTGTVANNGSAEVAVTAAPGGTILSSRLIKSSGSKDYDNAVLRALDKLGSLPRDTDGRVPPSFMLVFRQTE